MQQQKTGKSTILRFLFYLVVGVVAFRFELFWNATFTTIHIHMYHRRTKEGRHRSTQEGNTTIEPTFLFESDSNQFMFLFLLCYSFVSLARERFIHLFLRKLSAKVKLSLFFVYSLSPTTLHTHAPASAHLLFAIFM